MLLDKYFKYHGSEVWSTDRYEIKTKSGNTIFRSNYDDACDYIRKNIKNLITYEEYLLNKERQLNRLFYVPRTVTRLVPGLKVSAKSGMKR